MVMDRAHVYKHGITSCHLKTPQHDYLVISYDQKQEDGRRANWWDEVDTSATVVGLIGIFFTSLKLLSRSQWPRGLRRGSATARLLILWVRIPPWAWMFVCCDCCVLSGRGLCAELITRTEESYRLWCVVVCDLETSWVTRPWPTGGLLRQKTNKNRYWINMQLLVIWFFGVKWRDVDMVQCPCTSVWWLPKEIKGAGDAQFNMQIDHKDTHTVLK